MLYALLFCVVLFLVHVVPLAGSSLLSNVAAADISVAIVALVCRLLFAPCVSGPAVLLPSFMNGAVVVLWLIC